MLRNIFFQKREKKAQKSVLVAPLDWGLGHATRCIPLIRELQQYPVQVLLAAEEPVSSLLRASFPQIQILPLRGYRIQYSRNKKWMLFRMGLQIPFMLYRLVGEHVWLRRIHRKHQLSAVIADNRFGLHHPRIKCIYITHQLQVKTGHSFADRMASAFHQTCIKRFEECWVPDVKGTDNLAGALSHSTQPLPSVRYIGPLSRLGSKVPATTRLDLLLLISGPEPQRSLLEAIFLDELTGYKGKAVLVRGLPADPHRPLPIKTPLPEGVRVFHHLDAEAMEGCMSAAALVICRSGYTTVMDLVKMGKRAVLIPTPGQAEQEYLSEHLQQQQYFCSMEQYKFRLEAAIRLADSFPYQFPSFNMTAYQDAIRQLATSL